MILVSIVSFIFVFFLFVLFVAHKMTRPRRNLGDWSPADLDLRYEDISFETEDGIELRGWWMDKGEEKTLICLHGYAASRWYEVYMKPLLRILKKEHYNLLYFDFRAHGKSDGGRTTFGYMEYMDLKVALDWLQDNHGEKCKRIGVIGYSMGGLVAIKGIAEDERLDCAVADSPPINMDATSARSLRYFAGIPTWFYHIVKPAVRFLFGMKIVDPFTLIDKVDKPLLLIAGENDPLVQISEIRKFFKESRNGMYLWKTEAEHVRSIGEDFELYEKKISSYFEENM